MSHACVDLLLFVIEHEFGQQFKDISRVLLYNEFSTVYEIKQSLKDFSRKTIVNCLEILIKYNIVSFDYKNSVDLYHFDLESAISFLFYNRYIKLAKAHFGQLAGHIVEIICLYGNSYLTEIFEKVKEHCHENAWIEIVLDKINELMKHKLLEISRVSTFHRKSLNPHPMIGNIDHIRASLTKRAGQKRSLDDDRWWNLQLGLNLSQWNGLIRDETILQEAEISVGKPAADWLRRLINYIDANGHNSVSEGVLLSLVDKKVDRKTARDELDDCLELLAGDNGMKSSDKSGYIDMVSGHRERVVTFHRGSAVEKLTIRMLSETARTVFGEAGLKIFTFVLENPFIEESAFRASMMIPLNTINSLLPAMLCRGFVSRLEMSRTKQYFDETLVSVLHVDLNKLVQNEQLTCYQCLYRLKVRYEHEEFKEKALIAKMYDMSCKDKSSQTVDTDETISIITELDISGMKAISKAIGKLDDAEEAIQNSLLLFDYFIQNKIKTENF